MFEREITRWQRTQKQMKSAQARYDSMEPPDDDDDERLARERRDIIAQEEWAASRLEREYRN